MDELLFRFKLNVPHKLIYMMVIYFSKGWQPRWFILDNGILSYYLSSQEVNQGSRGSVKVVSCNIKGTIPTLAYNINHTHPL